VLVVGGWSGGELLGEPVVLCASGVQVDFDSFGTDTQGGACLFERGEPDVRGGGQLVTLALLIGADASDFLGSLGAGARSAR
jgi:hypothetical protein